LQSLYVHFLPALIENSSLTESVAVIIDILRASSTIVTALHNGAKSVIPCGTPEAARKIRTDFNGRDVLLGGERGGVLIEGFDCGNSPAEYAAARVAGKTIAFTTTNGTRALLKAAAAETILIGAFVNRKALIDRLASDQRTIHLVCAGTDGSVTGEDVLFAGSVVDALTQRDAAGTSKPERWNPNDCAKISQAFWRQAVGVNFADDRREELFTRIETAMRETRGGLNLRELGYDDDIRLCSEVDLVRRVPELNRKSGELI